MDDQPSRMLDSASRNWRCASEPAIETKMSGPRKKTRGGRERHYLVTAPIGTSCVIIVTDIRRAERVHAEAHSADCDSFMWCPLSSANNHEIILIIIIIMLRLT